MEPIFSFKLYWATQTLYLCTCCLFKSPDIYIAFLVTNFIHSIILSVLSVLLLELRFFSMSRHVIEMLQLNHRDIGFASRAKLHAEHFRTVIAYIYIASICQYCEYFERFLHK